MATPRKRPEDKLKTGRPTAYSAEMVNIICDLVATRPHGLHKICEENDNIPNQNTINMWRWKHPEFSIRYQAAKLAQADLIFEKCEMISEEIHTYVDALGNIRIDSGAVARHKHITDVAKWTVSKLAPQKYGDKALTEMINEKGEEILAEVKKVQAGLNKKSKKAY